MGTPLEELKSGDRVRVLGGKNYDKFHGGMEGTILQNNPDCRSMNVQFDDVATAGLEPLSVGYRQLEQATGTGGYRAGHAPTASSQPASQKPKEPQGPLLDVHGNLRTRQLVRIHGLQSAAAQDLNGKFGRLRKFDQNAERWEVDVRAGLGIKRLKEENVEIPSKPQLDECMPVADLKDRGNKAFLEHLFEEAIMYYTAAIDLSSPDEKPPVFEPEPTSPDAKTPVDELKFVAILFANRAQVYITLCREIHGEEKNISSEARSCAMRANMDAARAIDLDPTFGKAYYRRGCAVLGMAPSASRAKEAIHYLEVALSGRASGSQDGIVLPNAMRHEVSKLLDYAKRRLDDCVEAAVPDVEQCRQNCNQQ